MRSVRPWLVSSVFVALVIAVAVWVYPQFPARVPTHWNGRGVADGWSPPWAAALWPVLLVVFLAVLTPLLPRISPRHFEITPFKGAYQSMLLALQGFALVAGVTALLAGAGHHLPISVIITCAVGVLLVVLGNYMGKLRKNFFIGIKTPWTLASDATWERTHRLAGWLFVAAGLVWIGCGLTGAPPGVLLAVVLVAACVPAAYSFLIYRRLEGRPGL